MTADWGLFDSLARSPWGPGFVCLLMTVTSGATLCTDIAKGVYQRFRTMPFWQPAAVIGMVAADAVRYVAGLAAVLGAGLALGFRPAGGVAGAVLAAAHIIFFAHCVSWVFAWIGNLAKRPETVSGSSMMVLYPLLFASSVLVDTATMPRWRTGGRHRRRPADRRGVHPADDARLFAKEAGLKVGERGFAIPQRTCILYARPFSNRRLIR